MLEERIEAKIEQAVEVGTFEVGVETVRADSLSTAGRETLYEHHRTGAVTDLVEIVRRHRLEPTTADHALYIAGYPGTQPAQTSLTYERPTNPHFRRHGPKMGTSPPQSAIHLANFSFDPLA